MARYQPTDEQAEPVPNEQPRKIGYVTQRLDDLKTAPVTKTEPEATPYVITDWASF